MEERQSKDPVAGLTVTAIAQQNVIKEKSWRQKQIFKLSADELAIL